VKYYIYISDAKVDMLFPQVPHEIKKKVALEFKMDLKLLSASRKLETESEDNRIARLETVVDFINQYGNVGSIDQPAEYISGALPMRWGPYGWDSEKSPMVYFGAETDQTILGLGGSIHHLLGSSGEAYPHSHSATPFLLGYLSNELNLHAKTGDLDWARKHGQDFSPLAAVELATTQMMGPEQNVEFLARRLMSGPVQLRPENSSFGSKTVLLATPLYVALAD